MDASSSSDEEPGYSSFGPACEHCHRPDISEMTWRDGMNYFFSTFFATSRMWPIGYILDSPYSPLRVERAMPSRNWRDAFEDLLALEAGRGLIKEKSRKAENVIAARIRYERTKGDIWTSEYGLKQSLEREKILEKARKWATSNNDTATVQRIQEHLLPNEKAVQANSISRAQEFKARYEEKKAATASNAIPRGQWITSLIASGALPAWKSTMYANTEGIMMIFERRDVPVELDAGVSISEYEIDQIFEHETHEHRVTSPAPLRLDCIEALAEGIVGFTPIPGNPLTPFETKKSSVIRQDIEGEAVKLSDGSLGTKVKIENSLVDGRVITKEYTEEPGKVLEEVEDTRMSMEIMKVSVLTMVEKFLPWNQVANIDTLAGDLEEMNE